MTVMQFWSLVTASSQPPTQTTPVDRTQQKEPAMSRPSCRFASAVTLFGVFLACPGLAAEDAVKIPDTPAGKQLAAWLKAYNSGDQETQRQFVTRHFAAAALKKDSVERRLNGFQMVYHDNRTLELVKIEKATDHDIEAIVRSKLTESWLRVSLK